MPKYNDFDLDLQKVPIAKLIENKTVVLSSGEGDYACQPESFSCISCPSGGLSFGSGTGPGNTQPYPSCD